MDKQKDKVKIHIIHSSMNWNPSSHYNRHIKKRLNLRYGERSNSGKIVNEVPLSLLPQIFNASSRTHIVDVVHIGRTSTPAVTPPVVVSPSRGQVTDVIRGASWSCPIVPPKFKRKFHLEQNKLIFYNKKIILFLSLEYCF